MSPLIGTLRVRVHPDYNRLSWLNSAQPKSQVLLLTVRFWEYHCPSSLTPESTRAPFSQIEEAQSGLRRRGRRYPQLVSRSDCVAFPPNTAVRSSSSIISACEVEVQIEGYYIRRFASPQLHSDYSVAKRGAEKKPKSKRRRVDSDPEDEGPPGTHPRWLCPHGSLNPA